MTDESQRELRDRILYYVAANLNEDVVNTAGCAFSELLSQHPDLAVEVLPLVFAESDYWAKAMAHDALGLPFDADADCEDLLQRFESLEEAKSQPERRHEPGDWKENGF